ncbi:MFS transporter [Sphingobium sp. WCS2017Hpa-17]|uniref:MFS transporter n=1 Tax=Sphingobium sp. WCS2017Hpa-17 TaxID=3073638 RepID=UPI00288C2776|nr:MFS transporter [Sphingobium sp. WCS2017Hpa-17]
MDGETAVRHEGKSKPMEVTASRFLGPRMVIFAALLMNMSIGLTYGALGALMLAMETRFAATRSEVSLTIAFVVLTNSIVAPFVSTLARRFSLRAMMISGALLGGIGYLLLPFAHGPEQMLLVFAILIGPGGALMGATPAYILVTNWYVAGQGRALGIVNMPVMIMIVPLVVAAVLPTFGLEVVLRFLGVGFLAGVLPALFVIDRPEFVGQAAAGRDTQLPREIVESGAQVVPTAYLLRNGYFLLMTLGVGLIVGAGVAKTAHLVPLLTERGWSVSSAAVLLSISGGTGIAGSLLFGYLADRFNAGVTLALNAAIQAAVWIILLLPVGYPLLVLDAIIIGACGGGVVAAHGVLATRLFGPESFGKIVGVTGPMTIPFLFGMGPLAGILRDKTGNYGFAVSIFIAGFLIASISFLILALRERRKTAVWPG